MDEKRLVIGTRYQIWTLRKAADIAAKLVPRGQHDAYYIPRASHCHASNERASASRRSVGYVVDSPPSRPTLEFQR